jgi:hypothetical protein
MVNGDKTELKFLTTYDLTSKWDSTEVNKIPIGTCTIGLRHSEYRSVVKEMKLPWFI